MYSHTMTAFQNNVYKVVSRIPKGGVLTYGDVARKAGSPRAARAVGTVMAQNPYPKSKVPCHRVVCSDGRIGGYSGVGGSMGKEKLLRAEGVFIANGRVSI